MGFLILLLCLEILNHIFKAWLSLPLSRSQGLVRGGVGTHAPQGVGAGCGLAVS